MLVAFSLAIAQAAASPDHLSKTISSDSLEKLARETPTDLESSDGPQALH